MLVAVCFVAVVAMAASPAEAYATVDSRSNVSGLEENPSKLLFALGLPKDISVQVKCLTIRFNCADRYFNLCYWFLIYIHLE
jgi:hypothetical protein